MSTNVFATRLPSRVAVPEELLRTALDEEVLAKTQRILPGLAVFYIVLAASQSAKAEMGAEPVPGTTAFLTAVALVVLSFLAIRDRIPAERAHLIAFVTVALGLLNSFAQIWVRGRADDTLYIVLLLLGAACVMLSVQWMLRIIGVALGGWLIVAWMALPQREWLVVLTFGAALCFTGLVTFAVHHSRFRKRRAVHLGRLEDEIERLQLQESQARYELAVRGANDGLWYLDFITKRFYCSPRWCAMLGLTEDEAPAVPSAWAERIHPDDAAPFQRAMAAHLDGQTDQFDVKHRLRQKNGSYRWVLTRGVAVRNEQGEPIRIAGSQTDVTHVTEMEQKLFHDAMHDNLTGLPNRNFFMSELQAAAGRGRKLTVIFIDLDRFKPVNDTLGHSAGDLLLRAVADRLGRCRRAGDFVARLGGDEFVILLGDPRREEDAATVAAAVGRALREPVQINGNRLVVSASIGIAAAEGGSASVERVLRNADIAMYYAKRERGQGRIRVFDNGMLAGVVDKWRIQNELSSAIEQRQLLLDYQPLTDLRSGRIVSAEALLRWRRTSGEIESPGGFISVAEETGMIVDIGEWALWTACAQNAAWRREGLAPIRVAVNVSARQLDQSDFSDTVERVLADTKLEPRYLTLELTETALMDNPEAVLGTLSALKRKGVEISIDDFGTGYSSLSYLQSGLFDNLKIDRSFIAKIGNRNGRRSLAEAMISLAHGMDLTVTAEGVETSEQLRVLRNHFCDQVQGFLIGRPVSPERFVALLRGGGLLTPARLGPASDQSLAGQRFDSEIKGPRLVVA